MTKKTVKTVTLNHRSARLFWLNLIEFTDGTRAEEPNEGSGSNFIEGEEAMYEVKTKGASGKPDWITKVFSPEERPPSTPPPTHDQFVLSCRDLTLIAQAGIHQANQYMSNAESDIDVVIAYGLKFSEGIISNAKTLFLKYNNPHHGNSH